ncbi:MAG: hypothetical protein AAGG72_09120 [Pseudomonadota bacterium]
MKTTILLPLILIPSFLSLSSSAEVSATRTAPESVDIMRGCRKPVLDTREASRILFHTRLDQLDETYGQDLRDKRSDPLFIAWCGADFVLFNGVRPAEENNTAFGDVLYLRFQDRSYALLEERWG